MTASDIDSTSEEFAGKVQLKRYGQFLQQFYEKLKSTDSGFEKFLVGNYPVFVDGRPTDNVSIVDLVESGNIVLDKILTTLLSVCVEADFLKRLATEKFYPFLLVYGEIGDEQNVGEATALKIISEALPFLQELSLFVERCSDLVRNIIHQLSGLYQIRTKPVLDIKEVHFTVVFEMLSEILTVLITLDEIIAHNAVLKEHWNLYTKTLRLVRHNPEKFETDLKRLKPLESICQKLDAQLMTGYIFQNCVDQPFDTEEIRVSQKGMLLEEFVNEMKQIYQKYESRLDTLGSFGKSGFIGLCGLYVVYFQIYRTSESKFFKSLCDCYKKMPCFTVIGDILWNPVEFFVQKLPDFVDKKLLQNVITERNTFLQNTLSNLPKEVSNYVLRIGEWVGAMTSLKMMPANINTELDRRNALFFRGLKIACEIGELTKIVCNGRLNQTEVSTTTTVECVFRLLEMMKIIEDCFMSRWILVCDSVSHICQKNVTILLDRFSKTKDTIKADKKYSGKKLDTLCGLSLIESSLSSAETIERSFLFKLSSHIVIAGKVVKADDLANTLQLFDRMQILLDLDQQIRELCDCSFLLFHRNIIPVYFDRLFNHPTEFGRLPRFFASLNDVSSLLEKTRHEKHLTDFETEILTVFQDSFLSKINELIENDLRLSIHTHLKLEDRNPFNVDTVPNIGPFFSLGPLRLGRKYVDINRHVENYLEKTFYNLTTVALHDWKTYGEMRQLAERKYGLQLVEPHLPSQTLEQGLDTLEIMRNIHVFVAKYNYSLNDQIFVENASNNKHLNTLNIRHVANSIRTHGTGIMNTTVNFTYQFLRKKFYIFSQFLYDDHIKSRLTKDARYFRDHKEQLNGMYPFEKAEKFNRGIRKLGYTPDGLSYFDQFRQLITQIGNALGYVRLVRAGGLQACSRSVQFVPDLEDVISFAPLSREANLCTETVNSGESLDNLVDSLIKNFEEGTEYFKLLVDVFSAEFRNSKNVHLRNFFVIVPALTVNFVEHLMTCKERLTKKTRDGAAFIDDGFAMGIAYILKLLDQYNDFDSLHWFSSVSVKYKKEQAEFGKSKGDGDSVDEKLQHTLTLTKRRIDLYSREFDLVNFALRSARIFFRTDVLGELIPKDKEPSDADKAETASVKSGS